MVDSVNKERLNEAHEELTKLMQEKELKDASLLILANKQVSKWAGLLNWQINW